MPRADRLLNAVAIVDAELAQWAKTQGIAASAGQIRRWRKAGLLPAPTTPAPRPNGAPAGRNALTYTETARELARKAVAFLAERARPGRSAMDLALLMFAAGVPVMHQLVVDGMRSRLQSAWEELDRAIAAASADRGEIDPAMTLSDTYERAEAAARRALSTRSSLAQMVRRQLRAANQPAGGQDVLSVLTGLLRTILGDPPPSDDTDMLDQMLHAFDGHGLVEPLFPDGPVVVPEGPAGFGDALAVAVRVGAFRVPDDIGAAELSEAREWAAGLSVALASIPHEELRHHLGGDAAVHFWQPDDPFKIALMLNYVVTMRREVPLDAEPIIDAVRTQGWLPHV